MVLLMTLQVTHSSGGCSTTTATMIACWGLKAQAINSYYVRLPCLDFSQSLLYQTFQATACLNDLRVFQKVNSAETIVDLAAN
mmetsp:Transcript_14261/g.31536  ORF Transcript_14261/g.31536 Transcript_14261/m.31536 type:complete len:83 (+) Transcript_14261:168-416(+)